MAIICARCNKHIAPMSDGGDRYLCAACIAAGHRLPEWDDKGGEHKPSEHATDRYCVQCDEDWPCRAALREQLAASDAARRQGLERERALCDALIGMIVHDGHDNQLYCQGCDAEWCVNETEWHASQSCVVGESRRAVLATSGGESDSLAPVSTSLPDRGAETRVSDSRGG